MGILRTSLVIGAAIALMPSPPPQLDATAPGSPGTFAYLAAATETFSDLKDFCARRPAVCETAGQIAAVMEAKAKYSFKLVYEWANDATGDGRQAGLPRNLAAADDLVTGTIAGAPAPTRYTLLPDDMVAPWQGPSASTKG